MMNKYQEMFNFFIRLAYRIPLKYADDKFCDEYDKNIDCIKELVYKETSMKPIEDFDEDGEPYLPRDIKLCPVCGEYVQKKYNENYCGNCGQKLDWSE